MRILLKLYLLVFALILFMAYLITANSDSYDFSKTKSFSYDTSESIEITEKCYDYLKALSSYLKANPAIVVRIKGHSDNAGTFDQNEDRAYKRATFIFNYLMNEGIEADRIFLLSCSGSAWRPHLFFLNSVC